MQQYKKGEQAQDTLKETLKGTEIAIDDPPLRMLYYLEYETHGNILIACNRLGIERSTFYRWMWNDEFYEQQAKVAIRNGKTMLRDLAEAALVSRITAGDTTAIIFTLKNLDKENYGEGLHDTTIDNRTIVLNNPDALATILKIADRIKAKQKAKEENAIPTTP